MRGKRILLAGATGLIGTFLVDTLFSINRIRQLGMTVYAVGRDEDTARQRFDDIWEDPRFSFYPWDVTQPASFPEPVDRDPCGLRYAADEDPGASGGDDDVEYLRHGESPGGGA